MLKHATMSFFWINLLLLSVHLIEVRPQRIMMGMSMDWAQGNDMELMEFLQPINVGRDRKYDNMNHDDGCICTRDCSKYREPRLCYYKFFIEQYSAMGPACRNCSTGNTTNCYQQQCITADGIERMVFSINRMIPGPTINVCYGDRIIVDVMNLMTSQSVAIHWHGMIQRTTPWMDGVPYLSQCPIPPNGQFRYDFPADSDGTLFYHSHMGNLQRDGIFGALIVRTPVEMDPNHREYDYDLPSHTININDWFHFPSDTFWPGYFRNSSFPNNLPETLMINGRGSYADSVTRTRTPHAEFHVKSGHRYRFRIIGSVAGDCLYQLAIQDHSMTVIAVDGYPVKPVVVNTLVLAAGIRTDVVIHTNRKSKSSYWIVVSGMDFCSYIPPQTAYLVYDNARPLPTTPLNVNETYRAPYLDNVLQGCVADPDIICSDELRSTYASSERITSGEPDYRFFLDAGFHAFTFKELFENKTTPYQAFFVPGGEQPPLLGAFVDTLMNISSMMPPVPLLTQRFPIPENMICHGDCDEPYCSCINILQVELDTCVELVMTSQFGANHPFHIHGHNFAIIKMGNITQGPYWLDVNHAPNPVIRDVVLTPTGGFVVARFIANNPGYWMFHCHFQNHLNDGMFLIFKVGERSQFVPPPRDFPKCGPYLPRACGLSKYSAKCSSTYASDEDCQ